MFEDTRPAELSADGGPDPWGAFRVGHPGEVMTMLRQVRDGSVPVVLSTPRGHALTTTLWAIDEQRRRLNFSADETLAQLPAMIESNEAVAVAYLESVKLQFELHGLLLVRSARACALQSEWPTAMYRFQRREAYRVRTLDRHSATAQFRHPSIAEMALSLRVIDVSIGGCALFLPNDVPPLQPGSTLNRVRVELDADTRFEAALLLHHVTSIPPSDRGLRVGCEWERLDGAAERALQRYIDQTQKRRRLMSLE
jgi:c-di-GMP-binding flagellar brake protein YcgR